LPPGYEETAYTKSGRPEKDWEDANLRLMDVRELADYWSVELRKGRRRLEVGAEEPSVQEFDDHF
jgi:hypothetical protein